MSFAVSLLSFLHNGSTLLFGIFISTVFLGIRMTKKNLLALGLFSAVSGLACFTVWQVLGEVTAEKLYPLMVHLPLILFLIFFFRQKTAVSVLSVITAYLCCQVSNWLGLASLMIFQEILVYYVVRVLATAGVFVLLLRYLSEASAPILNKPTKAVLLLSVTPATYYVFDYVVSVYLRQTNTETTFLLEFQGFFLSIAYLVFLFLYLKLHEEKADAEQRSQLLEMKYTQAEKEMESLQRSHRDAALLRHDMRHLLSNTAQMVRNGESGKALDYIDEILETAERTATRRYCKNDIVNIILSSYEEPLRKNGIEFRFRPEIPKEIPCSDVDMTAILSNGLENALRAASLAPEGNRKIELDLKMNGTKLLISLKNTYAEPPEIIDGMPAANRPGHGLGTQSIRYVAERLRGNCQFSLKDEWFVLQIIL